jgi:hypothetical protein
MVSVAPVGPYATPLNWRLSATSHGEIHRPFALYVQSNTTHQQRASFTLFRTLPLELQLHILSFCDNTTLFQVMHTSSTLRDEAAKLFWSCPNAWYHIDGHWLLAGGFPADAHYATSFLACVQQIEVVFHHVQCLDEDWDDDVCTGQRLQDPYWRQEKRRHDFWLVLRSRFPRARRVVLGAETPQRAGSSLPDSLKMIVQACPTAISAFVSMLQSDRENTNHATRYRAQPPCQENRSLGSWEVIDPEWTRETILIPPKAWSGPVGEYAKLDYLFDRYWHMRQAVPLLRIWAMERYHFATQHNPFPCPVSTCDACFELAGQWALHAVETAHYMHAKPPPTYEERFAEHNRMLDCKLQEDVYGAIRKIRTLYGGLQGQQQTEMQQAFLYQLENDPLYAHSKPAHERSVWLRYLESMSRKRED